MSTHSLLFFKAEYYSIVWTDFTLVYLLIHWLTPRMLSGWNCENHAALNLGVSRSLWVPHHSFECTPRVKLLNYMVILCLIFWGTTILFSMVNYHLKSHQGCILYPHLRYIEDKRIDPYTPHWVQSPLENKTPITSPDSLRSSKKNSCVCPR